MMITADVSVHDFEGKQSSICRGDCRVKVVAVVLLSAGVPASTRAGYFLAQGEK